MFQYATARALADRLGTELLLDTRAFEHALAFQAYTPTTNSMNNMRGIDMLGVRFLDGVLWSFLLLRRLRLSLSRC